MNDAKIIQINENVFKDNSNIKKFLNKTKSNNPRLTINGIIKKHFLDKEDKEFVDLLSSYQKIENGSKMWGMFTDFNFYSLEPHRALYIEGFGKAYQKDYKNDK